MRRHQIDPGRIADVAVLVVEINEKKGRQGHDFPGPQKEHGVAGAHDQRHAEQQQQEEEPVRGLIVFGRRNMAQGDMPGAGAGQAEAEDGQKKKGAQAVKADDAAAEGQPPRHGGRDGLLSQLKKYAGKASQRSQDRSPGPREARPARPLVRQRQQGQNAGQRRTAQQDDKSGKKTVHGGSAQARSSRNAPCGGTTRADCATFWRKRQRKV